MATTPFTILTGFLGAGKTTTLNRMLAAPQGRRIAVLVNELGRIAIDSKLIIHRGGDVLELAGGCLCCKIDVKNDLWDGIADVIRRSAPDQVVLETTGIAEPAVILHDLVRLPDEVRGNIEVAGVVCAVDAEAGAAQLDRRDEACEQVKTADRLLLTKLDLAPAATVTALHARLDQLNRTAERASFPTDDAGSMALVHWLLERRPRPAPGGPEHGDGHLHGDHAHTVHGHGTYDLRGHVHGHHLHRDGQVNAVAYVDPAPLLGDRLMALLESLGDRLLRAKGFVHLAGEPRRGFVERAGLHTSLRLDTPWPDAEPRRNEIVLIGEDLDEAAILRALWACRAAG